MARLSRSAEEVHQLHLLDARAPSALLLGTRDHNRDDLRTGNCYLKPIPENRNSLARCDAFAASVGHRERQKRAKIAPTSLLERKGCERMTRCKLLQEVAGTGLEPAYPFGRRFSRLHKGLEPDLATSHLPI